MNYSRRAFLKATGSGVLGISAVSPLSVSFAQSSAQNPKYFNPLDGYILPDRQFDSLEFGNNLYESSPRLMEFNATTLTEAVEWQQKLRSKLLELMGGFPEKPCPLNARILEIKEFPEYTREKLIFQSRPNMSVFGYFMKPVKYESHGPVVICLAGHGRGLNDIMGINDDGTLRTDRSGIHHDYALQALDHGFAVLAIEQFSFGVRRDKTARRSGPGTSSCMPSAGAALLFGKTMVGLRVYDVMRAIDYLETRSNEVDPGRLGVMGLSGGGLITFYAAAADTRIKVGYVSGYFNLYRDCIMAMPHCICNYIPGILNYAEMYDIAGLVPPRAFFVESGTKDLIFPVEATKESFAKAKKIFEFFGSGDKIDMETFEDEHTFYGRKGFQFLKKWL